MEIRDNNDVSNNSRFNRLPSRSLETISAWSGSNDMHKPATNHESQIITRISRIFRFSGKINNFRKDWDKLLNFSHAMFFLLTPIDLASPFRLSSLSNFLNKLVNFRKFSIISWIIVINNQLKYNCAKIIKI